MENGMMKKREGKNDRTGAAFFSNLIFKSEIGSLSLITNNVYDLMYFSKKEIWTMNKL
jgi:hypothetical protein